MFITFATWLYSLIIQFYGTMLILIDNIVMDLVYLLFQEVLGPDHLCQDIIYYANLGLSWNISVKFFFAELKIGTSGSHVHEAIIVTNNILVHRKYCISIPLYIARFLYWQDQW